MDNQKFGAFIAMLRKERGLTQRQLADMLGVTDKAVSRWERGVGFPDIKTIKPLSKALEVSVFEIMEAERAEQEHISTDCASQALVNMIDKAVHQREIERRNITILFLLIVLIIALVFLIDALDFIGFVGTCFPFISCVSGVILIAAGCRRKMRNEKYATIIVLGALFLLFPVGLYIFFTLAFALGGPVPS